VTPGATICGFRAGNRLSYRPEFEIGHAKIGEFMPCEDANRMPRRMDNTTVKQFLLYSMKCCERRPSRPGFRFNGRTSIPLGRTWTATRRWWLPLYEKWTERLDAEDGRSECL